MSIKHPEIAIPSYMRHLPMTEKGYLKPWFVKGDDFRIVDTDKALKSVSKEACWICGNPFKGKQYTLVGSPENAITLVFREPPCHLECAEYAMQVCPFVLYPNSSYRTAGLDSARLPQELNKSLEVKYATQNPGEWYLVVVSDFTLHKETKTIRTKESDVSQRIYWKKGHKSSAHPRPISEYSSLPASYRSKVSHLEYLVFFGPLDEIREKKNISARAVTCSNFKDFSWRQPSNLQFAGNDTLVNVGVEEAMDSNFDLPFAFSNDAGGWKPVAIMGLSKGNNAYIDRQNSWLGQYLPEVYKNYPFKTALSGTGERLLCVDIESRLVIRNGEQDDIGSSNRSNFYTSHNRETPELTLRRDSVNKMFIDHQNARKIASQLYAKAVLSPITIPSELLPSQGALAVEKLLVADEIKIAKLQDSERRFLKDSGALSFAKAQIESLKYIHQIAHGA